MKKVENLNKLNEGELSKKLAGLEEDLRVLRFRAEGSKSKNVKESASKRKEIARILTFLREQKKVSK